MKSRKGINTGGGTPMGVSKPRKNWTRETTGIAHTGYWDGFSDVGRACARFLREREEMGLMPVKQAMHYFPKKIQITNSETKGRI
jgi:hypothetical protein